MKNRFGLCLLACLLLVTATLFGQQAGTQINPANQIMPGMATEAQVLLSDTLPTTPVNRRGSWRAAKLSTEVFRIMGGSSFATKGALNDSMAFTRNDINSVNNKIKGDTFSILIAGQSNAWGAAGTSVYDTFSMKNVIVWNHAAMDGNNKWQIALIGQRPFRTSGYNSLDGGNSHNDLNNSGNIAFYLAKKIAKEYPNRIVRIVIGANADGESITKFHNGVNRGRWLDSILNRSTQANAKYDLMIWSQGEADVTMQESEYLNKFELIKSVIREAGFLKITTPIICTAPVSVNNGGGAWQKDTTLKKLDYNLDAWDAYCNSDGLNQGSFNVHFDNEGYSK